MNLNKVFLIGRLTADPQLRTTPNGNQVANFSVATNRIWNDKVGGRREETEFHNVVLWGRQAEIASRFLAKGSLAMIEGRLQTRTWQDNQGQTRRTTEVIGERMQLAPRAYDQSKFASPAAPSFKSQPEEPAPDIPTIELDEFPQTSQQPAQDEEISSSPDEIKPEDLPF